MMRLLAALVVVLSAVAQRAGADVVILHDGREFVGLVREEPGGRVAIDTVIAGVRATLRFPRADVRVLRRGDVPAGFFGQGGAVRGGGWAAAGAGADDLYIEVPLRGQFGGDVFPLGVREALAFAARRGVGHVVFTVDSPGGHLWVADEIAAAMRDYDEQLTYHAVVVEAMSAAIWPVFACDTIHFLPGSSIGASVVFTRTATGAAQVDAKLNSAVAGQIASVAAAKGHNTVLARAMVQQEASACYRVADDGRVMIADALPEEGTDGVVVLDTPESVLTLTARDAVRVGLGGAIEGGARAVGGAIGLDLWRKFGDYGATAMRTAADRCRRVVEGAPAAMAAINADIEEAQANDPSRFQYAYFEDSGKLTDESAARWTAQTDAALAGWERVRAGVLRMEALQREAAELGVRRLVPAAPTLTDVLERVEREAARLRRERGRVGM